MGDIRIALLGFGNVARAFAASTPDLPIVAVADSTCALIVEGPLQMGKLVEHKAAGRSLREYPMAAPILEVPDFLGRLGNLGVSVLVESLPTNLEDGQPALNWVEDALRRGISVVTVDKGPLVCGFDRLSAAAQASGARLAFQGTTGVWPTSNIGDLHVIEIEGILNGTTNHILSGMCESGLGFESALREAQVRGIAEPDPRLDLDGWDAAAKILILAKALMNCRSLLAEVDRTGIGRTTQPLIREARSTGRVVRLMSRARLSQGRIQLSVAPEILGPDSPFYFVSGTAKAAIFHTEEHGHLFVPATSGRDSISKIIHEGIRSVMIRAEP